MKKLVQKFGGTSVQNEDMRKRAARHVKNAVAQGYKVVVVVSAMGREGDPYATDTLLSLVNKQSSHVGTREKDMLISCGEVISSVVFTELLLSEGISATSMTGAQAGFLTNEEFGEARIIDITSRHLEDTLSHVDVVVVAGFQGVSENGEWTTLGRGGSDTSATALAASLQAERVDIFTDVEGIMTADPRIVEEATIIDSVTYQEICNMAYQGAKVIHPRAVEIAMQAKIPIRIRSTVSSAPGTLITVGANEQYDVQDRPVTGIAHMSGISQITVRGNDYLSLQTDVFQEMAKANISVDFINIQPAAVVYTVPDERAEQAMHVLREKGYEPECLSSCAKVSAVGAGMTGVPGVASKIVAALAKENIQIFQSADSHTTIWVLVKEEDMEKAVLALHAMFQLEKPNNSATDEG
ncbi:aspartate kinase [Alteribacillus persepolensis]|uniref:Aspartokinase n=1 Tax=Alteribacillus persepolensis TaxID=568899 RepID=A0A1G7YTF0_9BACI|nr:aspartate kinase [Alteribacillus persepolensis]SDG99694.1 aspartate kinase [Alteribacillus persepolensis]